MIRYPNALWRSLTGHSAPGMLAQRNLVVIHSAEGSTAAGVYATFAASLAPHRVSAHFCVDRDDKATVYQYLDLSDTGWHASAVNARSIGIEHATLSAAGAKALEHAHPGRHYEALLATEAQYAASAALVAWLCRQMKIPCDRAHVVGHNEASPQDGHVLCPEGALHVDRIVELARKL